MKGNNTMRSSGEGVPFGAATMPSKDKTKDSSIVTQSKPTFIQSTTAMNSV